MRAPPAGGGQPRQQAQKTVNADASTARQKRLSLSAPLTKLLPICGFYVRKSTISRPHRGKFNIEFYHLYYVKIERRRLNEKSILDAANKITVRAVSAFGNAEKAIHWLSRPSRALNGSAPLDLLNTEVGISRVENLLGKIEHGIAA